MAKFSRRGFLTAAAGCAVVVGLPASAAAAGADPSVGPVPEALTAPAGCAAKDALGRRQKGAISASVNVTRLTDVVAMYYTVTNSGTASNTVTVYNTDQITSLESAQIVTDLAVGESFTGVMHGSLNHDFVFTVVLADGTSFNLAPVGEVPACKRNGRKYPKPYYKPGKIHQSAQQSAGGAPRNLTSGAVGLTIPPPGK